MKHTFMAGPTLEELATSLRSGAVTSRALVEECLSRIDDPAGEGARTYTFVDRERALASAVQYDRLYKEGRTASRYCGIPISVKDLFDLEGIATTAGSTVLAGAQAARCDAEVVRRLRDAGFIVIGRTNMTEFAFSGVGLNPHFGTPLSVWDRETGRIPGGSSSGAAVSVADGMAHAGIGTDTGGSCRIPAAFNGIVGFKPTAFRIPRDGTIPLSTTLDSIGPLARSVACCETLDAIMAGNMPSPAAKREIRDLRLLAPTNIFLDDMDKAVEAAFSRAIACLRNGNADIVDQPLIELDEIAVLNAKGGFSSPESFSWHERFIEREAQAYDPRVLVRILRGREQSAVDYIRLVDGRRELIKRIDERLADFDAVVFPTTPIVAPKLSQFESDTEYARLNQLCLRNPSVVNMWDGCAISLPIGAIGEAPVGLTLASSAGRDSRLFACARAVEQALRQY